MNAKVQQQTDTSFAVFNGSPITYYPYGFGPDGQPEGERPEMAGGYPANIGEALVSLVDRDFDSGTCHAPNCSESIGLNLHGEADEHQHWSLTAAWVVDGAVRLLCEEHHLDAVEAHPHAVEHPEF